MKAKELIPLLQDNLEADIIFWDKEDNWSINKAELDSVNKIEIILTN